MNVKNIWKASVLILSILCCSIACAETVWIDVRTAEEHSADNIPGDINIPYQDIVSEVEKLYSDKSTDIRLYCRSGRRAGMAMSKLEAAGYTHVSNAGGIDDARKERNINLQK